MTLEDDQLWSGELRPVHFQGKENFSTNEKSVCGWCRCYEEMATSYTGSHRHPPVSDLSVSDLTQVSLYLPGNLQSLHLLNVGCDYYHYYHYTIIVITVTTRLPHTEY